MTGYRASLIGADLVIQTPDGKRHDLGRVVGRDARQPKHNELIAAAREVIAANVDILRGEPGQTPTDKQLRAVCSELGIKPTPEQLDQIKADLAKQVPTAQSIADLLAPHVATTLADVARKTAKTVIVDEIAPLARTTAIEALPGIIAPLLPDVCERLIGEVLTPTATDAARIAALAWIRDHRDELVGAVPDHEWIGTRIRFRKPDGKWGDWRDLEGRAGKVGAVGGNPGNAPQVVSGGVSRSFAFFAG